MRKISYILFVSFLLLVIASCSKDNSPVATTTVATTTVATTTVPTTATMGGVGSLPPGVNGSISNTRVALYTSVDDWNFDRTFAFTACDANGNYNKPNITPGVYYMDACAVFCARNQHANADQHLYADQHGDCHRHHDFNADP